MSIWHKKIREQLEAAEFPIQENVASDITPKKLVNSHLVDSIQEAYVQLGGRGEWSQIEAQPYDFWVGPYYLNIDDAQSFNRYRLLTLQNSIYKKHKWFDLESYKRYCRQIEPECKKIGLKAGVWTNPEAEHHFGSSEAPGDFFGVGSAGWRYYAFQQFLADNLAAYLDIKYKRFSIFQNVMIKGFLDRVDKLLLSGQPENIKYVQGILTRMLAE